MPPNSNEYFVEFLNVPQQEQEKPKLWIPVQLRDGWYGLPSFKFMGLMEHDLCTSQEGIQYSSPKMMALANLLSHPAVTDTPINLGDFRGLRRCAKDLGRVLALAYLAGRDDTETWPQSWKVALQSSFPRSWHQHAIVAGNGIRELIDHEEAMQDAFKTTDAGLLNGLNVHIDALRGIGEQLLSDAIEPFIEQMKVP